jgi:tetratricopeptide (TPR) repeat protein
MVTLVARLVDALTQPRDAAEQFTAARYYERTGDLSAAEQGYRAILEGPPLGTRSVAAGPSTLHDPRTPQSEALRRLARLLKKQGKPAEALPFWEQLAVHDDVEALVEASKAYEWRQIDLARALSCARRALAACSDASARMALAHRVDRLQRKILSIHRESVGYDHKRSHDRSVSQYVDGSK